MSAHIEWSLAPQGTDEWLAVRRGLLTGSMAKVAREKVIVQRAKAGKIDKKTGEILEPDRPEILGPSAACTLYARNLARERVGGKPQDVYANAAMRLGTEQEPVARRAYEDRTGNMVEEVGFAFTSDLRFGCSVDGLIHRPIPSSRLRLWECKTIVSSDMLFDAVIDGDISAWIDQITFNIWILGAEACELYLHVWDLPELSRIFVVERDENAIQALEDDMVAFERTVSAYEAQLLKAMGMQALQDKAPAMETVDLTGNPPLDIKPAKPAAMAAPASTTTQALLSPAF